MQDQISLSTKLQLTLGTKLEYNDFSGFEFQPNVRLAWELSPRTRVVVGSDACSARAGLALERDIAVESNPASNPLVRLLGNDDFEPEDYSRMKLATVGRLRTRWPSM